MKINLTIFLFLMMTINSQAQVPRLVHYQGVLENGDGTPFNGTTDLHFSIYARPLSEQPIWSETHANVKITDGKYEVFLGSQNPLNLSFYEYFLEVKAEGMAAAGPKIAIAGSGYNFRLWFLFAAYTIVWLAIFLYMLTISRRQKNIISELQMLAKVTTE